MRGGWMTESWGKSDKAHHRLTKLRSWRWKNKLQKPAMGPGLVPEGKTDSGRNSVKKGCDRQCSLSAYLRITYRSDTSYRRIRKAIFRDNLLGRISPSVCGHYPRNKKGKGESPGSASIPHLCFLAALTWTALLSLLLSMMDGVFGSTRQAHRSFSCFRQAFCSEKWWEMTNTEVRVFFLSETCLETICKDIQTQRQHRNVLVDLKNTIHAGEGGAVKYLLSVFLFQLHFS